MELIDKAVVVAEIERRISVLKTNESVISMLAGGMFVNEFKDLLSFLDTLEVKEVKEEPVSNDLEEAADNYVGHAPEIDEDLSCFIRRNAFIAGAQWKKERIKLNL